MSGSLFYRLKWWRLAVTFPVGMGSTILPNPMIIQPQEIVVCIPAEQKQGAAELIDEAIKD